ncbi:ectoine hydroxylase [Egicoccus sp. AB-alg2]|uniref:ectoine hydroxylase n=1 Tax=Egicoccus sp. AB-alg2 TaxID=3242693 RepID=UPI00359DD55E
MASTDTMRRDPYPTRVSDTPQLLERQEPTTRGGVDDGPLGQDALEAFERDGYLLLPDVFSPDEVAGIRARLDELAADPAVRADERTITELESDEVRSIFEIHKSDPQFAKLSADPRVADVARQLLGSDVYIHQSRINVKPGFVGKGFWWHSDFETWHAEDGMPRMRCLSASITLTDNYPHNGPLMVVPGSHRTFVTTVGQTPADHYKASLKKQEVGTPDHDSLRELIVGQGREIRQLTGKAGSVVFFDCNIMHASSENQTPFPRSNVFLVYNSVENAVEEPFAAPTRRPEFIAATQWEPVPRV